MSTFNSLDFVDLVGNIKKTAAELNPVTASAGGQRGKAIFYTNAIALIAMVHHFKMQLEEDQELKEISAVLADFIAKEFPKGDRPVIRP